MPRQTQLIISKAEQLGFRLKRYATSAFLITAYEKIPSHPVKTIHIYIEGDGNSWKTRYQLSDNPTPKQPQGLSLACLDPYPHVVYLARPCQYTPLLEDSHCDPKYWSSHRYAPEVVAAMNEVLDQIKENSKEANFVLIGFSGGASIAVLLTSKRRDVVGLITVAGDLDHEALNQFHRTTPLSGSLNPAKVAHLLKQVPQLHLNGNKDKIVPTWLAATFAKKVNNNRCIQVITLKDVTHHEGWAENWADILSLPLQCNTR
ncbi:MAG: alpha/beta hydrolase [Proteobacteria bacterium]|nr:alpha/beta hydrolase [Pseudomonadota bacterium]